MNLRHLETLLAIAESGSFAAAAERVGVTQSAVSMQMQALEAALGTELFDRARRPPVLSEIGLTLLVHARAVVRAADDLSAAASGTVLLGRLRLGVIPTSATGLVPDALALLAARAPDLQIRIESGVSADLARRVSQGALDAALVTETPRLERGLVVRPILEEPLLVVAPRSAAGPPARTLLRRLPFVRFNRRTGVGRVIDAALRRDRVVVTEIMELDSIEAILAMVGRGLGVAVAPAGSVVGAVAETVHALPFGDPPVLRRVGLLERERPAGAEANPTTAALLEVFRTVVQPPAVVVYDSVGLPGM
jgi:DNA-binding transcriptional LysR family regulator